MVGGDVYETLIWLVPISVALAGLWWPRAGLLVLAATLPLFGAPPGGPYLGALDVAALAAIGTGLRAGRSRRSSLDVGVLAVVVVTLAAFFPLAYRPPDWSPGTLFKLMTMLPGVESWSSLYTWRAVANVLLGIGLYLAVKRAFGRTSPLALGRALGVGLLAVLGLGFFELAGWIDLSGYRPIGLAIFDQRFHSLFFHSGWMAEFVVLATPVAVGAWASGTRAKPRVAAALAFLALTAVLLSGQRGAWFAALFQVVIVAAVLGRSLLHGRRRWRFAAAGVTTMAVLVLGVVLARPEVGSSLEERLGNATKNLSNRTFVWRAALDMAGDRPLLGWGAGSFSPVLDLEVLPESSQDSIVPGRATLGHHHGWLTAHSTYLMFLAERGALGLASLLLVGWLAVTISGRVVRDDASASRALALGLLISAAGFAMYGVVQYLFFPRANAFLVWLLLGSVATLDPGVTGRKAVRIGQALIAAALILLPLRALAWEPAPARSEQSFGFHPPEHGAQKATHQWTSARRAVRRLAWEDQVLQLAVANGHPKASVEPVLVEVLVDGAVVKQCVAGEGWQKLGIYLGPPTKDAVLLEIAVSRTFRPFSDYRRFPDLPASRDIRRLGIAVGEISWTSAPQTIEIPVPNSE